MIPQYKLRRLAARSIRVAQDHASHPSIGLVKDLLTDTAREYISAYDDTSAGIQDEDDPAEPAEPAPPTPPIPPVES